MPQLTVGLASDIVADIHPTNIIVPRADGAYETFVPDVMVRNGAGVWTLPTGIELQRNSTKPGGTVAGEGSLDFGWELNSAVGSPEPGAYLGLFSNAVRIASTGVNYSRARTATSDLIAGVVGEKFVCQYWFKFGSSGRVRLGVQQGNLGNSEAFTTFNSDGTIHANGYNVGGFGSFDDTLRFNHLGGDLYYAWGVFTLSADQTFRLSCGPWSSVVGEDVVFVGSSIKRGMFQTPPIVSPSGATQRDGNTPRMDVTGKLGQGVSGAIAVDIKQPTDGTFSRILDFNNGSNAESIQLVQRGSTGAVAMITRSGGNSLITRELGVWQEGRQIIAFAVSEGFYQMRRVGEAAIAAGATALPAGLTICGIG